MGNALCTAPRGCAAIEVDRLESLKGSQRGESERVPPAGACGLFRRRRPCWLLDPEHAAVPIGADFELKAAIGSGSYAVTRMAVERATGEHFAVKSIRKAPLTPDERRRVRRELECIYHVAGHPNIVRPHAAYEDAHHVHFVMELCSGGSVADRILADGACSERDAARMVRALLEALAYAHDLGVVHRDVKIDNCLLVFNSPESPIKLVDWGYAAFLEPGGKLHKLCGTCYYLAPEVLAGCYDEKADVWSAGVTLYALLAGRLPFQGGSQAEVMQAIRSEETGLPDMTGEPWAGVGEAAKAAVAAMLTRDPARRPSAREMLAHPWLAAEGGGATAAAAAAEPELLHRIEAFSQMERLKQHAALYIARHLPSDQIRGLAVLFESLHAAGRTVIDAAALREALAARGGAALPGDGELSALLDAADLHGLGGLDLAEFLAAALHSSRLGEEANMLAAFKHFVRNGDGVITAPELAAALAEGSPGCAQPPSLEEAAAIIAAVDGDGDGTVDWKEFKRMMRADHPIGACAAAARISLDRHSSCGYYDLY